MFVHTKCIKIIQIPTNETHNLHLLETKRIIVIKEGKHRI